MPIYEYECENCGERFELRKDINDCDSDIRCPKCGTENLRRIFSMFATGSSNRIYAPSSPT